MKSCFSRNYWVKIDDVDFNDNLKPSAILNYFQDLATLHAKEIGIGYSEMLERGYFWIIIRIAAEVVKYPKYGSEITAETYPARLTTSIDACREYLLRDAATGEILVKGTSRWVVIGSETRRVMRIKNEWFGELDLVEPGTYMQPADKIYALEGDLAAVCSRVAGLSDMDHNFHTNNAKYADLILDAFSREEIDARPIKGFTLNFNAETRSGSRIEIVREDRNGYSVLAGRGGDGKNIFTAKVEF